MCIRDSTWTLLGDTLPWAIPPNENPRVATIRYRKGFVERGALGICPPRPPFHDPTTNFLQFLSLYPVFKKNIRPQTVQNLSEIVPSFYNTNGHRLCHFTCKFYFQEEIRTPRLAREYLFVHALYVLADPTRLLFDRGNKLSLLLIFTGSA